MVDGQLFWVPESSKAPVAAIVALVAIVLLALVFVLVVRHHRAGLAPTSRSSGERRDTSDKKRPGNAEANGGPMMPMRIGHNARTAGERQVRWRALSKLSLAIALVGASLLAAAPVALAHAQLLGTSPLSGSTVPKQPAEVIFKFNQAIGGTLGGGTRVQRAGRRGGQPRRGPSRRQTALDGCWAKAESSGWHLHRHLSRYLGRHAYRLRRPSVQHRSRWRGAEVHGGGADRSQQERPSHGGRLRGRARPRLRLARAGDRRSRVPAVGMAARSLLRGPEQGGPRRRTNGRPPRVHSRGAYGYC